MTGYAVHQAVGDVELAAKMQPVTVVASDTDILVLLTYHWKENMAEIHIQRAALLLWSSFQ